MIKLYLSTFFLSFIFILFAQKSTLYPLPSCFGNDFADSVLNIALSSNVNIVVLGEENHGGEYTNQINAALIQKLVKDYGFTTLVIESDFFSLTYADTLRDSSTFRSNSYTAWSHSLAFTPINQLYLRDSLRIKGFDSRHHGMNSKQFLITYLKANRKKNHTENIFFDVTESILVHEFKDTLLPHYKDEFFLYLNNWKKEISTDTLTFLYQTLSNLENFANQLLIEKEFGPEAYVRAREGNMITNISYLLNQKKESDKYIVLGASLHTQPGITGASKHASSNVGDYIYENYKEESLFILPVVYSGETRNYSFSSPQKVRKRGKRKTIQHKLAKSTTFTLLDYCYSSEPFLYTNQTSFHANDFCGYFIFIKEEIPRLFYERN